VVESDKKKEYDRGVQKLYNAYLSAAFSVFVLYLNYAPNPFNSQE